jgi:hypothetical protein
LFRYFSTAKLFVKYYLSGGKKKITEREVKKLAGDSFDEIVGAEDSRRNAMRLFYEKAKLPASQQHNRNLSIRFLHEKIEEFVHGLNWLRKKHGTID